MKKLFRLNENGVLEWIVAEHERQALEYVTSLWGIDTVLEEFREYLREYGLDKTTYDFMNYFIKEELSNEDFSIFDEETGQTKVKKVSEWLEEIK